MTVRVMIRMGESCCGFFRGGRARVCIAECRENFAQGGEEKKGTGEWGRDAVE